MAYRYVLRRKSDGYIHPLVPGMGWEDDPAYVIEAVDDPSWSHKQSMDQMRLLAHRVRIPDITGQPHPNAPPPDPLLPQLPAPQQVVEPSQVDVSSLLGQSIPVGGPRRKSHVRSEPAGSEGSEHNQ